MVDSDPILVRPIHRKVIEPNILGRCFFFICLNGENHLNPLSTDFGELTFMVDFDQALVPPIQGLQNDARKVGLLQTFKMVFFNSHKGENV